MYECVCWFDCCRYQYLYISSVSNMRLSLSYTIFCLDILFSENLIWRGRSWLLIIVIFFLFLMIRPVIRVFFFLKRASFLFLYFLKDRFFVSRSCYCSCIRSQRSLKTIDVISIADKRFAQKVHYEDAFRPLKDLGFIQACYKVLLKLISFFDTKLLQVSTWFQY